MLPVQRKMHIAAGSIVLIATLVCVFFAYGQTTLHPWAWHIAYLPLISLNLFPQYKFAAKQPQPNTLIKLFPDQLDKVTESQNS